MVSDFVKQQPVVAQRIVSEFEPEADKDTVIQRTEMFLQEGTKWTDARCEVLRHVCRQIDGVDASSPSPITKPYDYERGADVEVLCEGTWCDAEILDVNP